MVHGWGVSGALFDAQRQALSHDFRVVVPDLPGHGASSPYPADAGFSLLADALAELIETEQLRDVCLVGWSLGAMVAWDLLRRYTVLPIRGLVTIDMVPRLLNDSTWSHGLRPGSDRHAFDRQVREMTNDWPEFTTRFVPRIFAPGDTPRRRQLIDTTRTIALRNTAASMAAIWQEMVEQDFRADLPGIGLPTVVAVGARSQLYGKAGGEWTVRQLPHARLEVFRESGHAPHLEQPAEFNRMLAAFVSQLDQ